MGQNHPGVELVCGLEGFLEEVEIKTPEVRGGAVDLADAATWLECFEVLGHKLP